MTDSPLRPDARLVQLHAERGDPQARLAQALADLEDADWGVLFSGEAALARQLVALLGPGTLRVDGRLNIDRGAFAEAGLAVADLYGDLHGARAAWLLEPDDRTLERAARAGVAIIVDATLAPGGGWPARGADFVVYRNGVTLSGQTDVQLAALFGQGRAPEMVAPAPSALSVALALRDVATLPLRLARAARTVANVAERLGEAARVAGPTALLLVHEAGADTLASLGGVLAAARHVPEGLLLTPGLQDTDSVLALLREFRGPPAEMPAASPAPVPPETRREQPPRPERREERGQGGRRFERRIPRGDGARPDRPGRPERAEPDRLERFTFEAAPDQPAPESSSSAPRASEETWEPEIVFSDLEHVPAPITHTISNGPDAPDQREGLPDVLGGPRPERETPEADAPKYEADPEAEDAGDAAAIVQPTAATLKAARMVEEHTPNPEPDLPAVPEGGRADAPAKDDPAANLTKEQAAIYSRLREWRNAEAKRQEISRFIIASNASLAEIARRVPYTLDDLAAVRGMGKARLEKYGERILEVVRG